LRSRGGEVLKFLGDGVLATLSFNQADRARTCDYALDAAVETMRRLEVLNATRAEAGLPTATVDVALHIGEVLYGNVGATDRLDFTVIGPAVNEVTRIEALCEPLRNTALASAEFAAALGKADDCPYITRSSSTARRTGGQRDLRPGTELRIMTLASFNVQSQPSASIPATSSNV
jgi:adenylate cyclase